MPVSCTIAPMTVSSDRKTVRAVYALTLCGTFVWLAAIFLAPELAARGQTGAARLLYAVFSPVCHQIPGRCFALRGLPLAVCGRCLGVYAGFAAGNCLRCLWIVGAAAMASKLLAAQPMGLLKAGDGAVVGALTGIVAAVVDTVVKIPFRSFNLGLAQRFMERVSDSGFEIPSGFESWFDLGSGSVSPGWMLLGLFVTAAVYAIMGALGGVIGVSLFGKKPVPPVPPSPPVGTGGPTDAV